MDKTIIFIIAVVGMAMGVGKPPPPKPADKPCIGRQIVSYAKQHNIEPAIVHAVISVESAWKVDARGSSGELGLMQLMPATAKAMGVKDRLDPVENVSGGIRYLAYCKKKTGKAYLRCYNAGEKGIHNKQAYAYEQKVLSKLKARG